MFDLHRSLKLITGALLNNDAVAHNHALYQQYEDDLKQYVAR